MPIQPSLAGSGESSGIGVASAFSPFTKPKGAEKVCSCSLSLQVIGGALPKHTVSELKLIDNAAAEAPTAAKEAPTATKAPEDESKKETEPTAPSQPAPRAPEEAQPPYAGAP